MSAPLAGLRVLEIATFITGPYAAMLLADLGADVVKIESPGQGDPFRLGAGTELSSRFIAFNRGKRSVTIDLRSERGRAAALRLAERADVLVQNFRPGVTERLGLGYPALAERNPRLVYCSISGFGEDGPAADRPAYDAVGQAMSGLMSLLVEPGDPRPIGPALSDTLSGFVAAYGILAALQARERGGRGQHVRTSMLQATLGVLTEPAAHYFATGEVPGPRTRPRQSQSYGFRARDGRALVVHLSTPTKFWEALVRAVERPELAADPRFADYGARVRHYDELHAALAQAFAHRDRDEWLERLTAADVPCAPILSLDEVFEDPQVRHLGLEVTLEGSEGLRSVARPVVLDGLGPLKRPPLLGEHTDSVLAEAGYGAEEIRTLRAEGAVA